MKSTLITESYVMKIIPMSMEESAPTSIYSKFGCKFINKFTKEGEQGCQIKQFTQNIVLEFRKFVSFETGLQNIKYTGNIV